MRAVRRTADGVGTVVAPEPEGDGVLVHTRSAGICGSDIHALQYGPSDVTIGHEIGGVLDDGTPVAVQPNLHCGACEACRRGAVNLCREATRSMYGLTLDGGMAERMIARDANVLRLPDGLAVEALGLVEPISIAVHAVHRVTLEAGMRVLVVGAGAIGLAVVMAASAEDVDVDVDVSARHPHQATAAEALGGRIATGGDYDVVIDSVGTQAAIDDAVARVRYGGTIVEVGGWWTPVSLGVTPMVKEITLTNAIYAAHHHGESEFDQAARILAASPEASEVMVTHRFPLERAAEAFAVAADKSSGAIKVQLHP